MTKPERSQRIVSPCLNVCKIENNICIGCFRTLDEISVWSKLSSLKRNEIMEIAKKRGSQMPQNPRNKRLWYDS